MADKPISQFPAASSVNASDVLAGVQDGVTKKFSFAVILSWLGNALSNLFVPTSRTINNKALSADITLDASDVGAVDADDIGVAGGVAELDANGKVPASQLPTMPSDVEANPAGTATDTLTKLKVNNTIYSVPSGGGGSGAAEDTIAPVETSSTASTAHPLGSIFYLNGILYRALSDIAVGGTINTGTGGNATQTTVAQNFKRTVTLTSAEYAQLSAAEKAADIVYIVTDEVADYANEQELAYVEKGTTASRTYAVGEYFCWNGLLYLVTAAIQSGDPFTVGTNCRTTMLGNELVKKIYKYSGTSSSISFTLGGISSGDIYNFHLYIRFASSMWAGVVMIDVGGTPRFAGQGSSSSGVTGLTFSSGVLTINMSEAYAGVFLYNPLHPQITLSL